MSEGYKAISRGDRGYEALLARYQRQKGGLVVYDRLTWRAVRDNDATKFVLVGGASDFPGEYGQSSAQALTTEPPVQGDEKPKKKAAKTQASSELPGENASGEK